MTRQGLRNLSRPFALFGMAAFLCGCPPVYEATFCNATDQPLAVNVSATSSDPRSRPNHRAEVAAHEQRALSFPAWCQRVEVTDAKGTALWRGEIDFDRNVPEHASRHFLLTGRDVYVVPERHVDAWRARVQEIIRDAPSLRLCTQESYPYNVGLPPREVGSALPQPGENK